jgi:hypothetical protein
LAAALTAVLTVAVVAVSNPGLRFGPDGSFKIVQFTDIHAYSSIDARTVAAMNGILDLQRPDLVVITGDCIMMDRCSKLDDVKKGIQYIARPMEARGIPWAVTLGNHDHDNLAPLGLTDYDLLGLYLKYKRNVNRRSSRVVVGHGNSFLPVLGRASAKPVFGVWLLDSNAEARLENGDQKLTGYDWIHFSQIRWYREKSLSLEKSLGARVPSLMLFHIPLPEFSELVGSGRFTGEMNEKPSVSLVNGGLFATALERGDVKGMFVGHDHLNTFVGDWCGIKLGYAGSIGYDAYGFEGKDETERNRLRGARVFIIKEANPAAFETFYVTPADLLNH